MSQEILYTSAPEGLKPGSRGFCTVVSTAGMASNLAEKLESLSGYRHAFAPHGPEAPLNPVNYSHLILSVGGQRYHVLSRIADAGQDYTSRSNKLVHHVALAESELVASGPAAVLAEPGFCVTKWDGQTRILPSGRVPSGRSPGPAPCQAWQAATGDAGWAGYVGEQLLSGGKPASVIFLPGTDTLPLIMEVIDVLPAARRWDITFSSYFTKLPPEVDCQLRFVLDGTPEATALRRRPHEMLIDLARPLGAAPDSPLAGAARTGKREIPRPARHGILGGSGAPPSDADASGESGRPHASSQATADDASYQLQRPARRGGPIAPPPAPMTRAKQSFANGASSSGRRARRLLKITGLILLQLVILGIGFAAGRFYERSSVALLAGSHDPEPKLATGGSRSDSTAHPRINASRPLATYATTADSPQSQARGNGSQNAKPEEMQPPSPAHQVERYEPEITVETAGDAAEADIRNADANRAESENGLDSAGQEFDPQTEIPMQPAGTSESRNPLRGWPYALDIPSPSTVEGTSTQLLPKIRDPQKVTLELLGGDEILRLGDRRSLVFNLHPDSSSLRDRTTRKVSLDNVEHLRPGPPIARISVLQDNLDFRWEKDAGKDSNNNLLRFCRLQISGDDQPREGWQLRKVMDTSPPLVIGLDDPKRKESLQVEFPTFAEEFNRLPSEFKSSLEPRIVLELQVHSANEHRWERQDQKSGQYRSLDAPPQLNPRSTPVFDATAVFPANPQADARLSVGELPHLLLNFRLTPATQQFRFYVSPSVRLPTIKFIESTKEVSFGSEEVPLDLKDISRRCGELKAAANKHITDIQRMRVPRQRGEVSSDEQKLMEAESRIRRYQEQCDGFASDIEYAMGDVEDTMVQYRLFVKIDGKRAYQIDLAKTAAFHANALQRKGAG